MKCPRCKNIGLLGNFHDRDPKRRALYCAECGGQWVSLQTLKAYSTTALPEDYAQRLIDTARLRNGVTCPVDNERMVECSVYAVHIDVCPSCSGIWFDHGEYGALLTRLKAENFENLEPVAEEVVVYEVLDILTVLEPEFDPETGLRKEGGE